MGQIFNRLRRIVASYNAPSQSQEWANGMLESEDDELRRLINELSADSEDTGTFAPPTNVPADVVRAHTVLNVPVGATPAEIKKAYKTSITRWHPDKFANAPADEHSKAVAMAHALNNAYATLKRYYRIP